MGQQSSQDGSHRSTIQPLPRSATVPNLMVFERTQTLDRSPTLPILPVEFKEESKSDSDTRVLEEFSPPLLPRDQVYPIVCNGVQEHILISHLKTRYGNPEFWNFPPRHARQTSMEISDQEAAFYHGEVESSSVPFTRYKWTISSQRAYIIVYILHPFPHCHKIWKTYPDTPLQPSPASLVITINLPNRTSVSSMSTMFHSIESPRHSPQHSERESPNPSPRPSPRDSPHEFPHPPPLFSQPSMSSHLQPARQFQFV